MLTDQLSIALALSGQYDRNRALNEAAIKGDADYPIYYYNLARADALQGDSVNAKVHLKQCFAHEESLPTGEQMPDPINDESFAKLKSDPSFSAFVEVAAVSGCIQSFAGLSIANRTHKCMGGSAEFGGPDIFRTQRVQFQPIGASAIRVMEAFP